MRWCSVGCMISRICSQMRALAKAPHVFSQQFPDEDSSSSPVDTPQGRLRRQAGFIHISWVGPEEVPITRSPHHYGMFTQEFDTGNNPIWIEANWWWFHPFLPEEKVAMKIGSGFLHKEDASISFSTKQLIWSIWWYFIETLNLGFQALLGLDPWDSESIEDVAQVISKPWRLQRCTS